MTRDLHGELGRQVSGDERRLWAELMRRDEDVPYDQIRVIEAGRQCGLHEERARQIARTWANDGLVRFTRPGTDLVEPTSYGRRFKF